MNINHKLSALLFLMLTSQVWCMDRPRLRASTPLSQMLGPRQVEHPLLTKDKREANIALIKSLGAAHARQGILAAVASVCLLNVAKDIVAYAWWGSETLKPLTTLIPPNHLVPLQQCKPICYQSGCCGVDCPDFMSCGPIVCTNQTTCNSEPPSVATSLQLPTAIAASFNMTVMLLSTIALLCTNCSKTQSQEKLEQLVKELNGMAACPHGQDIETGAPESEGKPLINTDGNVLSEKQKENLELITRLGGRTSETKMFALLALLFGANAAKDMVTQQLWGFDTQNVEVLPNNSTQTSCTLNGLGTTSTASLGANCAGCVLSCLGAIRSAYKGSQEKKELEKLLKKLDRLASTQESE